MSKKGLHIDVLGESFLPDDLFSQNLGSSYGLGEYPDLEYGMGVLDPEVTPEAPEAAYRITARKVFASGDLDTLAIADLMKEGSLTDLSWLELEEQDIERLPKDTTHGTMIPELEDAWTAHQPVEEFRLHAHNVDLAHAYYNESLEGDSKPKPQYKHSGKDLTRIVRRAMRRSAAGHDLKEILREAAQALGPEAHRIHAAMKSVVEEHGLAGNVFIRASAYPGYEQGKWNEHLHKVASGARYILVDEKTLKSSTTIQNGRCIVTKKLAVVEVPWKEALAHYEPKLTASGRKVAGGDPRAVLRAAFLSLPEKEAAETVFPTHKAPAQRITRAAAWTKFQSMPHEKPRIYDPKVAQEQAEREAAWMKIQEWVNAGLIPLDQAMGVVDKKTGGPLMLRRVAALIVASKGASAFSGVPNDLRPSEATLEEAKRVLASVEVPQVIDISDRPIKEARERAHRTIVRWVRAGFLNEEQGRRLVQSEAKPLDVLHAASRLASMPMKAAAYSGAANDNRAAPEADQSAVWASLRQAEAEVAEKQSNVNRRLSQKLAQTVEAQVEVIKQAVDKGVRGRVLRDLISRSIPRGGERLATKLLTPILKQSNALDETPPKNAAYRGPAYRPAPQKVAEVEPGFKEESTLLHWVRKAMSEGFAGRDLDDLLEQRFSTRLRQASADKVAALRAEHEGGAGFVYVDASAYASERGTKGCEEGALKHRANGLKFVLAMDRCAGCALANPRPDGTRVCQTYNKTLMTAADQPDGMEAIRQENIRAARMSDEELTASYFAPTYDPSEFNLHNDALADITLREANVEGLGEILFGGMVLEDE